MKATLAVDEHHWWYRGRRRVIAAELDRLPIPAQARVLDAGCGSGRVTELLSDRVPSGRVYAIDVAPSMVEHARTRLGDDRSFGGPRPRGSESLPSAPSATPVRVHARAVPGWRTVELDPERSTIRLARGTTLDLGATAKALAADWAASRAARATNSSVLVSLSGDLAIAGSAPAEGWPVRVTDDHRSGPDAPGQTIWLRDGGLATSSTQARRWRSPQGEVHHLVDPASGQSAAGPWRTVSVAAATCAEANIASTAAILGGASAPRWLGDHGLPGRLVSLRGTVRHVGAWPRAGEDLPVADGSEAAVA